MIGIGYQMDEWMYIEKCALRVSFRYTRIPESLLCECWKVARYMRVCGSVGKLNYFALPHTCETSNGKVFFPSLSFTPTHFSTGPIFAAWLNNMIEKSAAASCALLASHLTAEMCEIAPPREGTSPTHPPGTFTTRQFKSNKMAKYFLLPAKISFRATLFAVYFSRRAPPENEILEARRFGVHQRARSVRIKSFGRRATDCGDRLSPYLLLLCCFIKREGLERKTHRFLLMRNYSHMRRRTLLPLLCKGLFGCIIALSISYAVLTLDCKFET